MVQQEEPDRLGEEGELERRTQFGGCSGELASEDRLYLGYMEGWMGSGVGWETESDGRGAEDREDCLAACK